MLKLLFSFPFIPLKETQMIVKGNVARSRDETIFAMLKPKFYFGKNIDALYSD